MYRTNNSSTAADATLSFSMCYTASTASYLNVSASSTVPLVQPRYSYDSVDGRIRFDDVRKQMLSSSHTTIEQRGILSLSSQVLSLQPRVLPEEAYMELPYLGNVDMEIAFRVPPEYAPTINLVQFYEPVTNRADISIGGLLLEVLREGGTPAEAVQSMFTALCASRYEDYVFLNDGNMTYPTRSDFVAVQVPGGKGQPVFLAAGPTRSYLTVMAAIVVHSLVTIFVIVWFCKGTCFWQQISYSTDLKYSYKFNPSLGIVVQYLSSDITSNRTLSRKSSPSDRFRNKSMDERRWAERLTHSNSDTPWRRRSRSGPSQKTSTENRRRAKRGGAGSHDG